MRGKSMAGRAAGLVMAGLSLVAGGRSGQDEEPVKQAIVAAINGPKKKRWWERGFWDAPHWAKDGGKRVCRVGMQSWNPRRQARRRLEVQYLAYCGKRLSGRRFRRMRRDQLRWNWMLGEPAV